MRVTAVVVDDYCGFVLGGGGWVVQMGGWGVCVGGGGHVAITYT